jgi:hypothetical protein
MEPDKLATIRERDAYLVRLLEAIQDVQASSSWSTLKEEFDGEIARLNRLLLAEAKKLEIDTAEQYRLQGRLESAKKYSLEKLFADSMAERDTIRRKLS